MSHKKEEREEISTEEVLTGDVGRPQQSEEGGADSETEAEQGDSGGVIEGGK